MAKEILIVATSNDKLGDTGKPTGCWAEEIMAPSMIFKNKGYNLTIASMKGGKIPIDAGSMSDDMKTQDVTDFYEKEEHSDLREMLDNSVALADVKSGESYDAIYVPGGHGVCWDMAEDAELHKLLTTAYEAGKIVSTVCHGPMCLINAKLSSGEYMVAGKKVTGFSDAEEKGVGLMDVVPCSLEGKLKEAGGEYSAGEDWAPHVEVDGNLITGQNPGSSVAVAEEVVKILG